MGTHLRELMWQAENATCSSRAGRVPSDIEAPPPVCASSNAGSSEVTITLRQEDQEVMELPSRGNLKGPQPDVTASPQSAEEGDLSFVDRSFRSLDISLALGWAHHRDRAPPFQIVALNRRSDLPRSPHRSTKLRILGQIYTAYLEPGMESQP